MALPPNDRDQRPPQFLVGKSSRPQFLSLLRESFPKHEERTIQAATAACAHEFDLLGSGPVSLGPEIPWQKDFKSGHEWPPRKHFSDIRPADYPGGPDIKVPWELSRCQHFVWLGQAYWFSGDEEFAKEFVVQVLDWIEMNPLQLGVNWVCPMDVAIRAVNWLWALAFFESSPPLTEDAHRIVLKSLLEHARHIRRNLEWSDQATGNHYLANVVGLVYLGLLLPVFKEAEKWAAFGLRELKKEMFKQVHSDGADFEASICYHRLVTEMFLSATVLAQQNGHTFPEAYLQRLESMIEFTMHLTKPDGTVPFFGDNDNGRLHRLKAWAGDDREWKDHRYLLAMGAVLFEREDFAAAAGNQWEEALWMLGHRAAESYKQAREQPPESAALSSCRFPDAGIFLLRKGESYLAVDAGQVGTSGFGGHAHSDIFSFELYALGQHWIVDPGTCVYTANYESRNRFRSTAFHNTVQIDGEEICRFRKEELFELSNDAVATLHRWETSENFDLLDASHVAYERLQQPVAHRRRFFFSKASRLYIVRDELTGEGKHEYEWHWHFAPELTLEITPEGAQVIAPGGKKLFLKILSEMSENVAGADFTVQQGWVALSYGRKVDAPVLRCALRASPPVTLAFLLCPLENGEALDRRSVESALDGFNAQGL